MIVQRFARMVLLGLLAGSGPLLAQNSVYGVQGVGFPGRPLSVYARALGGGSAAFDPGSPLNPATTAAFTRVTAMLAVSTGYRRYTAYDSTVSGLRETRFPVSMLGARLEGTPLTFALSFAPYLERSFDFRSTSVLVLRGDSVTVSDRVASDGGMADLRGALATRLGPRLFVGVAGHLLSGSSKLRVSREFSAATYQSVSQQSDLTFTGLGLSAGAIWRPVTGVQIAGTARTDTRLKTQQEGFPAATVDLPLTLASGLRLELGRGLAWASTVTWQSWSSAKADLAGASVFDTWDLASGVELGGGAGSARLPLRVGARYATLPFSGRAVQAHDLTLAAGSGLTFAQGRVEADFAVERIMRDGGGATERAWQFTVGLSIVP